LRIFRALIGLRRQLATELDVGAAV
jgi:hypothetical protein